MCVHSLESQTCPGLHKKERGSRVREAEPAYVQLKFSGQHGPAGARKEESNEYD